MHIVVVGTGYVGLVTGACLAEIGHQVACVDIDAEKIQRLTDGFIPIFEPGLEDVVRNTIRHGRLTFTTTLPSVLDTADVVFIAVGTPSGNDGKADLRAVYAVADTLSAHLKKSCVIVNKSTVPVGTGKEVEQRIAQRYSGAFSVVSCPEFLREGSAVEDFMHPDRIVIGARTDAAAQVVLDVFQQIKAEKLVTTVESAELIKYASNAFLATKISFINEIAHLCERAGGDIEEVAYGLGLDKRIGPKFLHAGIGWGGSCFPKDVRALEYIGGEYGYDFKLLKAVIEVNNHQRKHLVAKIKKQLGGELRGKRIGVLGLAFKGNTDDVRESAAIDIIQLLMQDGAKIQAFDYEAGENAKKILSANPESERVTYANDPYAVAIESDAIVVATEWPAFKTLDWLKIAQSMRAPLLFDGRNMLKPAQMRAHGFQYYSMGRNGEEPATDAST